MYWSSSLDTSNPAKAFYIVFYSNTASVLTPLEGGYRYFGMYVRPVTK